MQAFCGGQHAAGAFWFPQKKTLCCLYTSFVAAASMPQALFVSAQNTLFIFNYKLVSCRQHAAGAFCFRKKHVAFCLITSFVAAVSMPQAFFFFRKKHVLFFDTSFLASRLCLQQDLCFWKSSPHLPDPSDPVDLPDRVSSNRTSVKGISKQ